MNTNIGTLERMYDRFNAQDVDGVLVALSEDVTWANGMDGGHVEAMRHCESTGHGCGHRSVRGSRRRTLPLRRTDRFSFT